MLIFYEVQETATQRMEQMMKELLKKNPAPSKKENQKAGVQHTNMLTAQAEEVILAELVYCKKMEVESEKIWPLFLWKSMLKDTS